MQHVPSFRLHPTTRFLSTLFLFLLTGSLLISQSTITGRIVDDAGSSPEYASVLLLQSSDSSLVKGTILSSDGSYNFNDVNPGRYLVATSMIGYQPAYSGLFNIQRGNDDIQVSTLTMSEDVAQLEEVTIKTKKPLYVQKIDRLEVNVQSSATMAGNTALEILEKSPGVLVDRQNSTLNLRGKNGVSVMINGKMTRMPMSAVFGMLEGMPASNIDKLELITTPPANFDAEGNAGFINIILKKNEYEGLNGTISGTIGHGRQERYQAGGNINYRRKKINLYGDYNFSYKDALAYINTNRTIVNPEYTLNSISAVKRDNDVNLSNGRVGFDYYLSSRTVIGVLGTFYKRAWSQVSGIDALYMVEPGSDTVSIGLRNDQNNSSQYLGNFNLQHKINGHHFLNFDVDYIRTYSHQPQDYLTTFHLEGGPVLRSEEITIDKKTPLNIWVGKIDYTVDINEDLKLESGVKGAFSYITNTIMAESLLDGAWTNVPFLSESARMNEVIRAAYGSLTYNLDKKTGFKAGLRYEHTLTELFMESSDSDLVRNFGNFFPSVFFSRQFNETNSLAMAFNQRISRPTFNDLAPWVMLLDPTTYITGNINLLPAISSSLKADYSYKKLIVSMQYTRVKNGIRRFQPTHLPESDVVVFTSLNLDKEDIYSLSFSFPVKITGWWTMRYNLNGYITNLETVYSGTEIDLDQKKFDVSSNQIFELPNDYSIELSLRYFSKALRGIWISNSRELINIGFQKEFKNNRGTLSLNIANLLNEPMMESETIIPELNMHERLHVDFDTRVIKLSYLKKFGNRKIKSRDNRRIRGRRHFKTSLKLAV